MAREIAQDSRATLAVAGLIAVCLLVAALVALSLGMIGGRSTITDWPVFTPLAPLDELAAADTQDSVPFGTDPWMAFTTDFAEDTSTTPSGDPLASSESSSAPSPGVVPSPAETPANVPGADPAQPGADPRDPDGPANPTVVMLGVTGHVRHGVWRTPLANVTIRLSSGQTARTDSQGRYAFSGIAPGQVLVAEVSGSWIAYSASSRLVVLDSVWAENIDFEVYAPDESYGEDWHAAAYWRQVSDAELTALTPRVALASTSFAGITPGVARSILNDARNGSQEERALGELLSSWLDLAASDLGFDTRVDASATHNGVTALGSEPGTALALVRQADRTMATSADPDWSVLRKVLSARSLAD